MATFEFDISASTSVYNVDNNNPYIAFTGSNDFMSLDTNYTTLSGTLSLTTTNGRNSSSKNVKNITLLDTNNTEIGTITTNGINFEKGNTTTLPFSFSGVYNNREIGGMKISVGKDDGIDLYSFDINACGNTINKVVDKGDRWIKDKTKTFTIDKSIQLSNCAKTNLTTGLYNYIGNDNTSFIISPKNNNGDVVMAYLTKLSFKLSFNLSSSNTNNISYVIYGSNTNDNFTEIIHSDKTNLGASNNDIEIDISYPKPFKHYKFLITSVNNITNININIEDITPTFEQYGSGSYSLSNNLFREPHYEHFTNQRKFPDIIVPGILTLFFIGVLSLRK
jgi:hypothetical protein